MFIKNPWQILLGFILLLTFTGVVIFSTASSEFSSQMYRSSLDDVRRTAQEIGKTLVSRPSFIITEETGVTLASGVKMDSLSLLLRQEWKPLGVERLAIYNLRFESLVDIVSNDLVFRESDEDIAFVARNGSELIRQSSGKLVTNNEGLIEPSGISRYIGPLSVDGHVVGFMSIQIDNQRATTFVQESVSKAKNILLISLIFGMGLLLIPMYIGCCLTPMNTVS